MTRNEIMEMVRQTVPPAWLDGRCEYLEAFAKLVAEHTRKTEFKPDWNNYQQGRKDGAIEERDACLQIQEDWQYVYANDLEQKIRERGDA